MAPKTLSRLDKSRNGIFFNAPDCIPMSGLKEQLLTVSGMAHTPCLMMRLRKRTQNLIYPLMLQFQANTLAKLFVRKQSTSTAGTPFKNLKISIEKTPIQREIIAPNSHHSSRADAVHGFAPRSRGTGHIKLAHISAPVQTSPPRFLHPNVTKFCPARTPVRPALKPRCGCQRQFL